MDRLIAADDLIGAIDEKKGEVRQRGAGAYTLCSSCNNNTGGWYANSYVEFAKELFPLSQVVPRGKFASIRLRLRPLRVFKQILVMFCSANPPGFARRHPDLVRYVLNRESREYPDGIDIFASFYDLNGSRLIRQTGIAAMLDLKSGASTVLSEIAFPPFNFVMTLEGSDPPDPRLSSIKHFANFDYRETAEVPLTLAPLEVNSFFPGDYRTVDDLKALAAKNQFSG